MKNRKFESLIDDYLMERLSLNSLPSFKKMLERDEIIAVVKNRGNVIFRDLKEAHGDVGNRRQRKRDRDLSLSKGTAGNSIKM
jgi:hypothetical protein